MATVSRRQREIDIEIGKRRLEHARLCEEIADRLQRCAVIECYVDGLLDQRADAK